MSGTENIESILEIINIKSKTRRIIHKSSALFEAPNWHCDGHFLIINSQGLLYRISIVGDKLSEINSGFATCNNNDHGISPDGSLLVISHHSNAQEDEGNSIIYTLPIGGGEPKRITQTGLLIHLLMDNILSLFAICLIKKKPTLSGKM